MSALRCDMLRRIGFAAVLLGSAIVAAALLSPVPEPVATAGVMEDAPKAVAGVVEARILPLTLGVALVASGVALLARGRRERKRTDE